MEICARKWEDNVKMHLKAICQGADQILLTQDNVQLGTLEDVVTNLKDPKKVGTS